MGSYIRVYTDGGGIRNCPVPDDYSGLGSQSFVIRFPGFRKSLLASLVANSTAVRTSGVVTITATAHGITTGSTYVGYRFFYSGSPNLTAGWYDSILSIPDANTITFSAPGADFTSESINSAAAYTTLTSVCVLTIPANTLKIGSRIVFRVLRSGDATSVTKSIRGIINGSQLGLATTTTAPNSYSSLSSGVVATDKTTSYAALDNNVAGSIANTAADWTIDQTIGLSASLSAASGFVTLDTASVEIS